MSKSKDKRREKSPIKANVERYWCVEIVRTSKRSDELMLQVSEVFDPEKTANAIKVRSAREAVRKYVRKGMFAHDRDVNHYDIKRFRNDPDGVIRNLYVNYLK